VGWRKVKKLIGHFRITEMAPDIEEYEGMYPLILKQALTRAHRCTSAGKQCGCRSIGCDAPCCSLARHTFSASCGSSADMVIATLPSGVRIDGVGSGSRDRIFLRSASSPRKQRSATLHFGQLATIACAIACAPRSQPVRSSSPFFSSLKRMLSGVVYSITGKYNVSGKY